LKLYVPRVAIAVDDEPRNATVLLFVPVDLPADDPALRGVNDLRAVRGRLDMRPCDRPTHAFEQALEARDRIFARVPEHLELVAADRVGHHLLNANLR
jgi:hypothetical protein